MFLGNWTGLGFTMLDSQILKAIGLSPLLGIWTLWTSKKPLALADLLVFLHRSVCLGHKHTVAIENTWRVPNVYKSGTKKLRVSRKNMKKHVPCWCLGDAISVPLLTLQWIDHVNEDCRLKKTNKHFKLLLAWAKSHVVVKSQSVTGRVHHFLFREITATHLLLGVEHGGFWEGGILDLPWTQLPVGFLTAPNLTTSCWSL